MGPPFCNCDEAHAKRRNIVSQETWTAVDDFIVKHLVPLDSALEAAIARNRAQGLPAIDVSPAQGKLLYLLARMTGAKLILEIGTLGGYSTIWLARALPPGGKVVTLEVDRHYADVARANLEAARVADVVDVRVGPRFNRSQTWRRKAGRHSISSSSMPTSPTIRTIFPGRCGCHGQAR